MGNKNTPEHQNDEKLTKLRKEVEEFDIDKFDDINVITWKIDCSKATSDYFSRVWKLKSSKFSDDLLRNFRHVILIYLFAIKRRIWIPFVEDVISINYANYNNVMYKLYDCYTADVARHVKSGTW